MIRLESPLREGLMSIKNLTSSKHTLQQKRHFLSTAVLLISTVVFSGSACSTHRKHVARSASLQQADAGVPGKPSNFSWELAALPACYDAREGAEVFVWRSQKVMRCDTAAGKWIAGGAP